MTPLDISESQHARFSCSSKLRAHSLTGSQRLVAVYLANVQVITGTA